MDKLKVFLAVVKKHRFWFLCAAAVLLPLVGWWLAANEMDELFRRQRAKIEGDFRSVVVPAKHPNQGIIDKIHSQHDVLKRNVYGAWEILYREQKEKNPFPIGVLGEDFKKQYEGLPPQGELPFKYRERYQNFIKDYLPTLRKLVDVRHLAEEKSAAGGERLAAGGPAKDEEENVRGPGSENWAGIVSWDGGDYDNLVRRFEWSQTPSTLSVVMAQEDLWVYLALLRVIKNTNAGATSQANAAVKRIVALEIGKDAVKAWKNSLTPIFTGRKSRSAAEADRGTGNLSAEEQARQELMESRYIDEKGNPLPYQPGFPFASHPYAEFKMMPVYMSLVMDQRRLPKFLVECANSNMPVEVRRIRLLKVEAAASDSASGPGLAPSERSGKSAEPRESGQHEVPVEIHGIIYVYNPPDQEKLGTGAAAKSGATGTPATSPAPMKPSAGDQGGKR